MHNKKRLGIIGVSGLALVSMITGAFFLHQGTTHASAPAPATKATVSHAKLLHHTNYMALPHASAAVKGSDSVKPEIGPSMEKDIERSGAANPGAGSGISAPDPTAQTVTGSNPGAHGFTGITHADQRLASNGNQFSLEPPDQGLCVGQNYVVEPVNDAMNIYNAHTGVQVAGATAMNAFFGLPPNINRGTGTFGPFLSDPKCIFDKSTQRFFLTILEIDVDPATGAFLNHSSTLIAVSATNNPTGNWIIYSIDTTDDGSNGTPSNPNCPCFGDQPLIGTDSNGFYISTNEFPISGPGFNGAQIYAVSKTFLASGLANPNVVHINAEPFLNSAGGPAYSVQPAVAPAWYRPSGTFDNNTEYFLSALDFNGSLDNRIAVWMLTNTSSLNGSPSLNLSVAVLQSEVYGQPPNATQKAGPTPLGTSVGEGLEQLASNDDRMNQVVFANGVLWAGVNTIVAQPNKAPRSGVAYFAVRPSHNNGQVGGTIIKQGYISLSRDNLLFPSIAVAPNGLAVACFTVSGPHYYPSAGYARVSGNGTGPVHISGAGQLPEDGFTGYAAFGGAGVARWGDYSAAVTSPDGTIWMANEYIPNLPRTSLADWGTFLTALNPNNVN